MSDTCLYIPAPEDTLRGQAQAIFRRLAYDVWRREVRRYLKRTALEKLTIADIGCGPGFLLTCMERWFPNAELIGIDSDVQLLNIAKARCKSARTVQGDATSVALSAASVDILFALHVVEHLRHPEDFFSEARRILRPGGLLIVATPNSKGIGAKLMKDEWQGHSDPSHISLEGPLFWSKSIKAAGFEIVRDGTTGLSGIPLLNKMPLALIHWIPTFFVGYYPWSLGEAYVCIALCNSILK